MNFFEALALLVPGTNIKRSGWVNREVYIGTELVNFYDKLLVAKVLENGCDCTANLSNEDMLAEDWITSAYGLTNFNDVIINLKLGKKARRLLANTNTYLIISNGSLVFYNISAETFNNISLNSNDILAEDWTVFE